MIRKLNNQSKMIALIILTIISMLVYQFIDIDMNFFNYAMSIRAPKLLSMIIAAFCIGTSSIVFQTIINNRIVTPCLLGMNSLYVLTHTLIFIILGASSIFAYSNTIGFVIDILVMGVVSTIIYSYLFKRTKYNVLYVLLIGTVLSTLFSSISNSLTRIMDPNEFASLQNKLIAGFDNVNSSILVIAIVLITFVIFIYRKEIKLLNVICLGKNQAINLGVDYDKVVSRLLLGVTVFIAIATALVGPISFLGLILANISRQLFNTYKHSYLMIGAAFIGIIILLLGQSLIEHVFSFGTNISVFINIFGGGYFLYLILNNKGA